MRYLGLLVILLVSAMVSNVDVVAQSQSSKHLLTYAQYSKLVDSLPYPFDNLVKKLVTVCFGPISMKQVPSDLTWPFIGPISSYIGPTHPLGIDIDAYNSLGENVVAAADGVVAFAGGDPCCHYGYHVIIDHGYLVVTLYAHLFSIAVVEGQEVFKGELVGQVGSTGYSTGDLHFELWAAGLYLDPLEYLPRR